MPTLLSVIARTTKGVLFDVGEFSGLGIQSLTRTLAFSADWGKEVAGWGSNGTAKVGDDEDTTVVL